MLCEVIVNAGCSESRLENVTWSHEEGPEMWQSCKCFECLQRLSYIPLA